MTDGAGTTNYTYDNNGQLLSSTRGSDTFSYLYDAAGNITSRTYPDSTTTTYDYTNNENLNSATSGGNTTGYTYYPSGSVHTRTLANGYVETSTYSNDGRRTEINNAKSGTTLSDYTYTYDPAGNPTEIDRSGAVTDTTLYQYDNNDQLIDACYQATSCNEASGSSDPYIHYTYDGDGNRLTEARPAGTTTSTYNNVELISAGSTSYGYDANGNETSAGSQTFTFNAANQLTSTTNSGTTTTYTYDGDGNRLSESTGGTTTNFLWDTNGALPQLALERDGSGTVLDSYTYGNERVAMNSSGSVYYYLYDTQGSVANVTSSTGTTEWTYAYDPFGTIRTQTENDPSAPDNPMQYVGEMLDPTSGLYDLRARQYDPNTGTFLSQDPAAASGQTAGTYLYAKSNPVAYTDPSGRCANPPKWWHNECPDGSPVGAYGPTSCPAGEVRGSNGVCWDSQAIVEDFPDSWVIKQGVVAAAGGVVEGITYKAATVAVERGALNAIGDRLIASRLAWNAHRAVRVFTALNDFLGPLPVSLGQRIGSTVGWVVGIVKKDSLQRAVDREVIRIWKILKLPPKK